MGQTKLVLERVSRLLAELRRLSKLAKDTESQMGKFKTCSNICHRKVVLCLATDMSASVLENTLSQNGPAKRRPGGCRNIVGNCGCCHAEPRCLEKLRSVPRQNVLLLCEYSPCTRCAGLIADDLYVQGVFYNRLTDHDAYGTTLLEDSGILVGKLASLSMLHRILVNEQNMSDFFEALYDKIANWPAD